MPQLEFFVVSKSDSVDQVTNKDSVLDILEEIHVDSFPVIVQRCVAMSLWNAEAGDEQTDYQIMLKVTRPGETTDDYKINLRKTGPPRHRILQRILGLPLKKEGILRFEILLNDEHRASHIVIVHPSGTANSTPESDQS